MATIDKSKSQTYDFLSKNKSIENVKKQANIKIKEKRRHGYTYNSVTINDEKQRKKTEIEKIHEEILSIEDKIIFITTFIHIYDVKLD